MYGADDRTNRVRSESRVLGKVFGWHSVSCLCESCLDADAIFMIYGKPTLRSDMSGLGL